MSGWSASHLLMLLTSSFIRFMYRVINIGECHCDQFQLNFSKMDVSFHKSPGARKYATLHWRPLFGITEGGSGLTASCR